MKRIARLIIGAIALVFYVVVLTLLSFRLWAVWREDPAAIAPAIAGSQMVATPRGRIHVELQGPQDGARVVIVAGTAAWGGFWREAGAELAKAGYRVAAIDLPPFGYSDRPDVADYRRPAQAARIRETILGLGWSNAIIVGHSFGAGPAVEAALRYPAETAGLVIVDGALGLPADSTAAREEGGGLIGALSTQNWLMQPVVASVMTNPLLTRRLLAMMLHRADAATEERAAILREPMIRAGTTASYAAWLPALLRPETTAVSHDPASYVRLVAPTAIIWGAEDAVTPLPQGERLKALIAGATLDVLPGAGHIPHIEAPAAFVAALRLQLERLSRKAP